MPTEPDGHELEALKLGGSVAGKVLTLTGCCASLRPKYLRRSERSAGDGLEWKKKFCEDYRRLVIQNHFHKCTESCFKKFLAMSLAKLQSRSLSGRHVSTSFLDPVLEAMMKQVCWHSRRSKAYRGLPEARMAASRLLRMCWSSRGLPRLLLAPFTASSEK